LSGSLFPRIPPGQTASPFSGSLSLCLELLLTTLLTTTAAETTSGVFPQSDLQMTMHRICCTDCTECMGKLLSTNVQRRSCIS